MEFILTSVYVLCRVILSILLAFGLFLLFGKALRGLLSAYAWAQARYVREEFTRLELDGTWCVMENREADAVLAEDDSPYKRSTVMMTRDQFERLPDFAGF